MRIFLVIAFCCGVSLAHAQTPPRGEFGCTRPLAQCTQDRVAQLRTLSASLTAAADMKPPARLTADQRKLGEEFDVWLHAQSAAARRLADFGAQAKQMQELNRSFNMQYLQLQETMQNENRKFTMLSNIMKTKHDTAKNSIGNIR
jgi:hypothetical protein